MKVKKLVTATSKAGLTKHQLELVMTVIGDDEDEYQLTGEDSSKMLSCISVLWHVKEVSLWREPEKRSNIRDSFGQCAAVRLVDKIPNSLHCQRAQCCHSNRNT